MERRDLFSTIGACVVALFTGWQIVKAEKPKRIVKPSDAGFGYKLSDDAGAWPHLFDSGSVEIATAHIDSDGNWSRYQKSKLSLRGKGNDGTES